MFSNNEPLLPTDQVDNNTQDRRLRLYNSSDEQYVVAFKSVLISAGLFASSNLYQLQINEDKELARKYTVELLKNANTCSGMDWSTDPEQSRNVFTAALGVLPGLGMATLLAYLLNGPRSNLFWNEGDSGVFIASKLTLISVAAITMAVISNSQFNREANWTANNVYQQHLPCFKEDGSCGQAPTLEFTNFTGGLEFFIGMLSFIGAAALSSILVNKPRVENVMSIVGEKCQAITHFFDRYRMRNTPIQPTNEHTYTRVPSQSMGM